MIRKKLVRLGCYIKLLAIFEGGGCFNMHEVALGVALWSRSGGCKFLSHSGRLFSKEAPKLAGSRDLRGKTDQILQLCV